MKQSFHLGLPTIKNQVPLRAAPLLVLFWALTAPPSLKARNLFLKESFSPLRPLNKGQWQDLKKGKIIVSSKIQTKNGQQKLDYYASGLHPLSCSKALRKISQYESYKDFISFITKSRYNEKAQKIYLMFNHILMPSPLSLHFVIPRITAPGYYPFHFPKGLLKGLRGKIQVSPHGRHCFMEVASNWKGRPTGINDTVFKIFSITLAKLGIQKIFRISSL